MKVELVTITKGVNKYDSLTQEEIVSAIARHGVIKEDNGKLIKYLMTQKHWSPLDMIDFGFEIETSRAIGRQLIRHHSIKPQEHCITGDSLISFKSGKVNSKMTIESLYDKWHNGAKPLPNGFRMPMKDRIRKMSIKVYNEDSKEIELSNIKDVFYNGERDVYKLELSCGKTIRCTKEHKFFDGSSFKELKKFNIGDNVYTNGIPVYRSKEWLMLAKEESIEKKIGLNYIAEKAGCSCHTIRKWLKIHGISYSKKEVALVFDIWNKGKKGYKNSKWSAEARLVHSKNTPKGKDHHSWRGGGRTERKYIQDYINSNRQNIYNLYSGEAKCDKCSKKNCRIELHHIEPICMNPSRAYDITNIQPLCFECHRKVHKDLGFYRSETDLNKYDWDKVRPDSVRKSIGDNKPLFYESKSNRLTIKKSTIKSIEYVGVEKVYDLEINHKSHNYIANGIIVHNSQRYSDRVQFEPIELRKEHPTNRQSSTEVFNPTLWKRENRLNVSNVIDSKGAIDDILRDIELLYNELISNGVAKECARMILPECTTTTLTMKGSLRSWLMFLNIRCDHHTQKEARLIANRIGEEIEKQMPNLFSIIDWRNGMFI